MNFYVVRLNSDLLPLIEFRDFLLTIKKKIEVLRSGWKASSIGTSFLDLDAAPTATRGLNRQSACLNSKRSKSVINGKKRKYTG